MRDFIICTVHLILFAQVYKECGGWDMLYTLEKLEMHAMFWSENIKGRRHFGTLDILQMGG
jgi:hypothetical protein